jgi:hypothetical protein
MEKKINWKKGILGDAAQEVEEEEEGAEAEKVSLLLACFLLQSFLFSLFNNKLRSHDLRRWTYISNRFLSGNLLHLLLTF